MSSDLRHLRPHKYANGLARQDEILDAAAELFAANGFGTVSLRDLAAAVGISHQGIRRHFGSIDVILLTLLARYEDETATWTEALDPDGRLGLAVAPQIAERNQDTPGYLQLFVALAGEATSATHPAHRYFRDRYADLRAYWEAKLEDGPLPSLQLMAAWDGLQLHHLYAPEKIDVADLLGRRLQAATVRPPLPWNEPGPSIPDHTAVQTGYARGRAQRQAIITKAIEAFAEAGFAGTTMAEVAERVGVSKSTLIHHFPTKETLLVAVLEHRSVDRNAELARMRSLAPQERLASIPSFAHLEQDQPGLAQLYCVLAGESVGREHPGHTYFSQRLQLRRQVFVEALQDAASAGLLNEGIDPVFEGVWLAALWDGLLFQWLYQPEVVDMPAMLAAHLATLGVTAAVR